MRCYGDRIASTKRARNIRSRPHIVHIVRPPTQVRHICEVESLRRCIVAGVHDEDMYPLGRLARVVLWRRGDGSTSRCGERKSGGSVGGVLVERE